MNRPLIIGEKVHIRGMSNCFNGYRNYSIFPSIKIGIGKTSIPPETIFCAKDKKIAVMEGLNYVDIPRDCTCFTNRMYPFWGWGFHHCPNDDHQCWGNPFHLCISLCPNGSLFVSCNDTDINNHYHYPDVSSNTPLWLVIDTSNVGSIWISND